MTLFIDLDGTIIDVAKRYYQLHLHCLQDTSHALSLETYWGFKRERISEESILQTHYPQQDVVSYNKKRMDLIEDLSFLQDDKLLPGAREALQTLQKKHTLILATLRKRPETLHRQIDLLDLRSFFQIILVPLIPTSSEPWRAKMQLLQPSAKKGDWIMGDTEADIRAGQELELTTCATLSGIRSASELEKFHPDHIVASIADLPALLS